MKNLITRSFTGIVFVAVVIGSMLFNQVAFTILMLATTLIGLTEFAKLRPQTFSKPSDTISLILSGFMSFMIIHLVQVQFLDTQHLSLIFLIFLYISIKTLLSKPENSISKIAEFFFGLTYVVLPFALMTGFYQNETSTLLPELLIGFFVILWFNDVFAYLVGSAIGRTKLYEKVSPKKTWEGTIGGVILSMLSAYFLSTLFLSLNITNWLVIGFLISIFATLGDLLESLFKRQANVKDSGNIMPGHGGVLDRFDGLLLAAPAVYVYLTIIN